MAEKNSISLIQIWDIIKEKLWIVIGLPSLTTIISIIASIFLIQPVYEATTSFIIGRNYTIGNQTENEYTYNELMMYQISINTYTEIAKSRTVAEKAIKQGNLSLTSKELMNSTTISTTNQTQIMRISATSTDPKEAMIIANTMTECFIAEAARLFPTGAVQIIDKASLPSAPIKPVPFKNAAIAFALGLFVALGIVLLSFYMDDTIKDEKNLAELSGLPVIGIIPYFKENVDTHSKIKKCRQSQLKKAAYKIHAAVSHNKNHIKIT
jgi:capsular polysaccharide biosynthesis protein